MLPFFLIFFLLYKIYIPYSQISLFPLSLQHILPDYITLHIFSPPHSTHLHQLTDSTQLNSTLNSIRLNGLIPYFSADSGTSKGSFPRPPPSALAD